MKPTLNWFLFLLALGVCLLFIDRAFNAWDRRRLAQLRDEDRDDERRSWEDENVIEDPLAPRRLLN
jgi:hypothetical protein